MRQRRSMSDNARLVIIVAIIGVVIVTALVLVPIAILSGMLVQWFVS